MMFQIPSNLDKSSLFTIMPGYPTQIMSIGKNWTFISLSQLSDVPVSNIVRPFKSETESIKTILGFN